MIILSFFENHHIHVIIESRLWGVVLASSDPLTKKIREITANNAGEPDLYAYVRDLLTRNTFAIGLLPTQVVIDSKLDGSRKRPDLAIYRSSGGSALRGPDYVKAVFEVKTSDQVKSNLKAIVREKRAYVQSGTEWFFLIDQKVVTRLVVTDRIALDAALSAKSPIPSTIERTWSWDELADPEIFLSCFDVLSAENLKLEVEIAAFKANKTPFAYLEAKNDGRAQFSETIREASNLIREAVNDIVKKRAVEDLKSANKALEAMILDYGKPEFNWTNRNRPIDFTSILDSKLAEGLDDDLIVAYDERLDDLMVEISPWIYALQLEHELLQQYASRQGVAAASLLKLEGDQSKPNNRLLQALVYETSSLILSRMLMIRFSEDYGLFETRYISNGGIEVFWRFAEHFGRPMQALLRETYRLSRSVFRSIFDPSLLDWAVERDDQILSQALTRAALILSRWDFSTVRGDILSGVYDKYLDISQRRRLGEVYTRPEIARFMLSAAEWKPTQTVLDPACGTGTFLVEALVERLNALTKSGAVTDANVRRVLGNLYGLDISSFPIALAQIQIFWHLIELMKDKTVEEAREFAREILPVLQMYGGWSSLDPMGRPFGEGESAGESAQSGLSFRITRTADNRVGSMIPPGFARTVDGEYDLVIMNPPYIRSERQGTSDYPRIYSEVAYRGTDTSIYFIYRALKHWVKPGGKLAFIVPIGVLEAAYAGRLRRVLSEYRISMIADLEGLGKVTFRGVKRATVIVIVEKTAGSPDDDVEMVQLDPAAVTDDVIDFDRAVRSTVKRRQLDRSFYFPQHITGLAKDGSSDASSVGTKPPAWVDSIRSDDESDDAILTKLSTEDSNALETMAELPRLGDIVKVVWVKRGKGKNTEILDKKPALEAFRYRPEMLFGYGVKMGGKSAFSDPSSPGAIHLFKGQNIFPQGLLGQAMGAWSPTEGKESQRGIYTYSDQLSYKRTFAIRELSQLPTASQISEGEGFQNTAFVVELVEEFPLAGFLMSRIIQFYAARVLRSSIIEDLGCHWYKRTIPFIPIPPSRSKEKIEALRKASQSVLDADSDIASRYREIDALKATGLDPERTISHLMVDADPITNGIDLNGVSETPVFTSHISIVGDLVQSSDLFFQLVVPSDDLRKYIAFELGRLIEDDLDAELCRADVLGLTVPTNLSDVVALIISLADNDLAKRYADARDILDNLVADQCGIAKKHRDHMVNVMTNDPILSNMRPMIAQRGLRVQPYAEHIGGDRYD